MSRYGARCALVRGEDPGGQSQASLSGLALHRLSLGAQHCLSLVAYNQLSSSSAYSAFQKEILSRCPSALKLTTVDSLITHTLRWTHQTTGYGRIWGEREDPCNMTKTTKFKMKLSEICIC